MPAEFAAADLMLCRSGASTVAELAAAGRASLLVPFAAAADDHQRKNAEAMVEAGAARMLTEAEFTAERLMEELVGMLRDHDGLRDDGGTGEGDGAARGGEGDCGDGGGACAVVSC